MIEARMTAILARLECGRSATWAGCSFHHI
jgi:hypothetical protein